MSLFELRNVAFSYGNVPALRDVSLSIERGERLALIGANGSGKSTLLRLLDGLYIADSGSVAFEGRQMVPDVPGGIENEFRRRVGFVFQNSDVQLFNPTVREELAFGPDQLEWGQARRDAAVDAMLAELGIDHIADRPPFRLSGGEKKRVALASILILEPEVILLDEPTSGLDPRGQAQLTKLLRHVGLGRTLVFASHDLTLVERLATRCCVLAGGEVLRVAAVEDVLADRDLLAAAGLVAEDCEQ